MAGDSGLRLLIDIQARDSARGIVHALVGDFLNLGAVFKSLSAASALFAESTKLANLAKLAADAGHADAALYLMGQSALKSREGFAQLKAAAGELVLGFLKLLAILALVATIVGVTLAIAIGVKAVKAAADFQQGLNRLVTGAGDVTDNMTKMGQAILGISVGTGVLTDQLLPAMYLILSAGQRGAQAENTLAVAARGAVIEQAKVVDVANVLSGVMTNYGTRVFNATQFMNGLIRAVQLGKITLQQLAVAMGPLDPIAKSLGVSFNDVAAAMTTQTNAMIPAQVAATGLRFLLQSLENPTKKATAAMEAMGLSTINVANEMKKSLPAALQMIFDAAKRAGPEGSVPWNRAVQDMTGGMRSWRTALALSGTHMLDFIRNSQEIAAAMNGSKTAVLGWDVASQGFNVQMGMVNAAVQALFISIGIQLLPKLTALAGVLVPLIQNFAAWVTQAQPLSGIMDNLASAIATVWPAAKKANDTIAPLADSLDRAKGIMKLFPSQAKPMLDTFDRMKGTLTDTAHTMPALTDSFDRATSVIKKTHTTAVNPLVGALQWLKTAWDNVKTAAIALWNFLVPIGVFIGSTLAPLFKALGLVITTVVVPAWNMFVNAIKPYLPSLLLLAEIIGVILVAAFILVAGIILGVIIAIGLVIAAFLALIAVVLFVGTWVHDKISWLVHKVVEFFTWLWGQLGVIWDQIKLAALKLVAGILYVFSLIPGPLGTMASNALKTVNGMIAGIEASIAGGTPKVVNNMAMMRAQSEKQMQLLHDHLVGHSIIPDMVTQIGAVLSTLPGIGSKWFTNLKNTILAIINTLPALLFAAGLHMIQQLAAGIMAGLGAVVAAAVAVANAVKRALGHSTPEMGPLRGDDLWGLHFALNFADGIRRGLPAVSMASMLLASMMAQTPGSYGLSGYSGGYSMGGTSHVTIIVQSPSITLDGREVTDRVMRRVAKEYRITGQVKNL